MKKIQDRIKICALFTVLVVGLILPILNINQGNKEPDLTNVPLSEENIKYSFEGPTGSLEWSKPISGQGETPALWDFDNDGIMEILIETNSNLYCFAGDNRNINWIFNASNVKGPPLIADVQGDSQKDIIIGESSSAVVFEHINSLGAYQWSCYGYEGTESHRFAVGDVDNDNIPEIISYYDDNKVTSVSGLTQTEDWTHIATGFGGIIRPLIVDIDHDGIIEVIIGFDWYEDYNLLCLSGNNGNREWNYTINPEHGYPVVADVDGDNNLEILIGSDDNFLYCISHTGTYEWAYQTQGDVLSSPAVADIDADGIMEVIFGSADNKVYCLSGNGGTLEWNYTTTSSVYSSPSIADIDDDGEFEVLVGSDIYLYCLSYDGSYEWNYTANGIINKGIIVCDVDGDGKLEIVFHAQNDALYCLRGNGPSWGIPSSTSCLKGSITQNPNYIDDDGDGLSNIFEEYLNTNPNLMDSDLDGIDDDRELELILDPSNNDTDSDLMDDGWELLYSLDPLNDTDAGGDLDGDTLTNLEEYDLNTYPNNTDSDSDMMEDDYEFLYSLDPTNSSDAGSDLDGDTLTNLQEYNLNTFPNNTDSDSDLMGDGWEVLYSLDPLNDTDARGDLDGDTLTNLEEYDLNTYPNNTDSDSDLMDDGWEILYTLNPLLDSDADGDLDGDGLTNLEEYNLTTYPNDRDSDDDGYNDKEEIDAGTDPLNPLSYPIPSNSFPPEILLAVILIVSATVIISSAGLLLRKRAVKKSRMSKSLSDRLPDLSQESEHLSADKASLLETPELAETSHKKKKSKNIISVQDIDKRLSPEELEELKKTESEMGIRKEKFICVVHKGPIEGTNIYLCPDCHMLYCVKCATALKANGEKCWSCNKELKL